MKIKARIITYDNVNYPEAPDCSKEFDVNSIDDIVSNVELVLDTFNGIYPDYIMIEAWDDEDNFNDIIFEYETERKHDKLNDVRDELLDMIRNIDITNMGLSNEDN